MIRKKEILHLAYLCRIECSEEEGEKLAQHLDKVITYIDLLNEVDTTQIEHRFHFLDEMRSPLREDEEGSTLSTQEFLDNAPAHVGGMIKIPPVFA